MPAMVSIDLDNIIYYHSPPIPKPPCKPPRLVPSRDSSHLPSNQPFLIHPLPPRPPCLSHDSQKTPHSRRQSPSVVSCLPSDRDAQLNEFDKELANLGLAEIEPRETLGLCFEGREERQAWNIGNVQGEKLHDVHGISHSDDRCSDDLQLSQDHTTLQDTTASYAVESGFSSAAHAPASPMGTDGPVSRDEPCLIQYPSSTVRRETQLSLVGYETEVNSVVAGEPCQALTSQHDCNVSRDQSLLYNPSTPVPAGSETGSTSQRLFRWSHEADTELSESSLPPLIEAPSIQLQSRDLPTTRDSPLQVLSNGNEIHSTDCRHSDEALSNSISPVLQQQEQASPRSEGEDLPRNASRSCSVSVVVPVTRFYEVPVTRSTTPGDICCTGKRNRRAKSACEVDSDDPDDSDYTDEDDSGVGDVAVSPRPVKRRRRAASTKTQTARVQRDSPRSVSSSQTPEEAFANPRRATSLQDMQTIPVRGFLTRQTFLSRVVYSCTFEEDRQPSCPHESAPTKTPAHDQILDKPRHPTLPSGKNPSAHATRYLPDEDELLIELKERRSLPWTRIVKHFPGRTKGSLQVHYSTKLKGRGTGRLRRGPSGPVACPTTSTAAPREACGLISSAQMARRKGADSVSLARQRYGQPRAKRAIDRYSPA